MHEVGAKSGAVGNALTGTNFLSYWLQVIYEVRKWWNWQTHHLEGVAPKGVGVQIPPSAPILRL